MTPAVVLLALHLLTGPMGAAPCTVRLRVQIEPKAENRSFTVTLNSLDYYASSAQGLAGAEAPKTQPEQEYRDLPPGEYEIRAAVSRPPQRDVNTTVAFSCK